MDLEKQVVSLENAQRLKALGVKQWSVFHWERLKNGKYALTGFADMYSEGCCAAYTVAELGEVLPVWCSSSRNYDGEWEAYPCALYGDVAAVLGERSEADVRAKLLIAILEKYPEYPENYY